MTQLGHICTIIYNNEKRLILKREVKRIGRSRALAATVLMLLGTVLIVDMGAPEPTNSSMFSLSDHDAIEIDGNAEFAATAASENWTGSGTQLEPYIIEDLKVDADFGQNGIRIDNESTFDIAVNGSVPFRCS